MARWWTLRRNRIWHGHLDRARLDLARAKIGGSAGVGTVTSGPQLIQAQPLGTSGELATTQIAESLDANGHLTYNATVVNNGTTTVSFQWRGGGF